MTPHGLLDSEYKYILEYINNALVSFPNNNFKLNLFKCLITLVRYVWVLILFKTEKILGYT